MSSFRPLDSIRALAVGPQGEVFVFYCFGSLALDEGTLACCVLDRQGKYLRTIMPYPANLPDERLRGLKRIEREAGVKVPFLYQGETRSFVPGAGEVQEHRAIATRDGRVAFMGVLRKERHGKPTMQMVTLGTDGGVTEGSLGARFPAGIVSASLALSPDERTIYASDVRREGGFYGKPVDAIYRFGWNDRESTLLVLRWSGAAGEHGLNDPKGIAVDREGNVLVADKGHDRLVVFRADGAFLAQQPIERPERVEIDRRTGAVYVLGGRNIDRLQKLDSWQQGRVVATTTIPFFKHQGYRVTMALDDRAERPILWIATAKRYYAKFTLLRIEDEGLAFGRAVDVGSPPHAPRAAIDAIDVTSLSLNRREGLLQIGGTTHPTAPASRSGGARGAETRPSPLAPRKAVPFTCLDREPVHAVFASSSGRWPPQCREFRGATNHPFLRGLDLTSRVPRAADARLVCHFVIADSQRRGMIVLAVWRGGSCAGYKVVVEAGLDRPFAAPGTVRLESKRCS